MQLENDHDGDVAKRVRLESRLRELEKAGKKDSPEYEEARKKFREFIQTDHSNSLQSGRTRQERANAYRAKMNESRA